MGKRRHEHGEYYLNKGIYARVDKDNKVLGLFNHSLNDDCEYPLSDTLDWFKESEEEWKAMNERNQKVLAGAVYEFHLRFRGGSALKVARAMRKGQTYLTGVSRFNDTHIYAWIFDKNAQVDVEHVEPDWDNPVEHERHGGGLRFHYGEGALVDKLCIEI